MLARIPTFNRLALLPVLLFSFACAVQAADGYFTTDQVASGAREYGAQCAVCHGSSLSGGAAPALVGSAFLAKWRNKSVKELYAFEHGSMPMTRPGSLSDQEYADVTAFILSRNGVPAGAKPLDPASPVRPFEGRARKPTGSAEFAAQQEDGSTQPNAMAAVPPSTKRPTQIELDGADADTRSWLTYNKGYLGYRYSTLKQITVANANRMRAVCAYQLGDTGAFQSGLIVYDGVMYATTMHGVFAIDAANCAPIWNYQYVPPGPDYSYNGTNRGVAIGDGRVIRGTQDGHVFALDAKTGALLWDRAVVDASKGEFFAAAPLIWNDLVFLGMAGGDWGIRGRMMAFNAADGSLAWTFELIPTADQKGADSWENPASAQHGGGSTWTSYSLDPDTQTLFVPVGNPGPDFNNAVRPGKNLFTNSVVALNARSGTLKWWYQLVANDAHDWDTTVVSLFEASGRKLVAVAGKDGVLHVLDRAEGKLVFKIPVTTLRDTDVPITEKGTHYCPGTLGGVEWNAPAYSPQTALLYVNAVDWCVTSKLAPAPPTWQAGMAYAGLANGFGEFDPKESAHGWTNAVDAKTGKMKWRYKAPTPMTAALTPTAGGVLFTGDLNGNFLAMDARTGKILYTFNTGGAVAGGVVTYEQGGKQYVAVASGNNSRDAWLTRGSATIFVFGL